MRNHKLRLSLALCVACVFSRQPAAELQNVEVNGSYLTDVKDSVALVYPLTQPVSGDSGSTREVEFFRLQSDERIPAAGEYFPQVVIPEQVRPVQYADLGRVFLAFYIGHPDRATSPVEITITLASPDSFAGEYGEYQVYSARFEEPSWHPRLVDIGPWSGKSVSMMFRARWEESGRHEVLVGLPRIVTTHGPYHSGSGGITVISSRFGKSKAFLYGSALPIAENGLQIDGGMLLIRRWDCLEPTTIRMTSEIQDFHAALGTGQYWLPLQLPAKNNPEVIMGVVEGLAAQGPIDVVKNFMANDEKRLAGILEVLDPPLAIPLDTPLFHPAAGVLVPLPR